MMNAAPPVIERLHEGKPIVTRDVNHPWENKVTFNPACALVDRPDVMRAMASAVACDNALKSRMLEQPALVALLYRAQGRTTPEYDHTRSTLGLAICTPRLELLARFEKPVMFPDAEYDNLGVEDPRITRVGNLFKMIYTGNASTREGNCVRICLATSPDLVHWTKQGPIKGAFNTLNNKNGMLFEPSERGEFLMLHRPMEGDGAMMVHWAAAADLHGEWESRGVLIPWQSNPRFKDVWVGGGAPPLLLADGRFLVMYHIGNRDANGHREYDLGLALFDGKRTQPIVKRSEPLLRPATESETTGDVDLGVNNVVFVCGAYRWEEDIYFPYAGADSCVLAGRIKGADLERWLGS
jgi:beta-1,2-mannobiose phosphorylase / 1,2-beta-oligomannan phosphorylase